MKKNLIDFLKDSLGSRKLLKKTLRKLLMYNP